MLWSCMTSGWLAGWCEDLETKQEIGETVKTWRRSAKLETVRNWRQCEIEDSAKLETQCEIGDSAKLETECEIGDSACRASRTTRVACCSTPNSRPPATKTLHTICGNDTSIVSSSWWWACECPKHVEQIIIAIKHSEASSWFSSLRLYYDARTNIHQI